MNSQPIINYVGIPGIASLSIVLGTIAVDCYEFRFDMACGRSWSLVS